jgi:hypothetical protein
MPKKKERERERERKSDMGKPYSLETNCKDLLALVTASSGYHHHIVDASHHPCSPGLKVQSSTLTGAKR